MNGPGYPPDVTQWKLDPAIVEATNHAAFSDTWPAIAEGWLKLVIARVKVLSFWVRGPVGEPRRSPRNTRCLAWSLQGAETVVLERIQRGGEPIPIKMDAPPFPREYAVTIEAETVFRISAFAEGAPPSSRNLVIKTID